MAIYLGSTEVADIYLGESGYGLANVVRVYLDSTIVWPLPNLVVSGITDTYNNATALNGTYSVGGTLNGKYYFYGPNLTGTPPANLSGKTICVWSGSLWDIGFEQSGTPTLVPRSSYGTWTSSGTSSLFPPTSGWSSTTFTGSITVSLSN